MKKLIAMLTVCLLASSCKVVRELQIVVGDYGVQLSNENVHNALRVDSDAQRLGVQFHGHETTDLELQYFNESVFNVIRVDAAWGSFIEKIPGQYNWSHLDKLHDAVCAKDGRLIIILNYGNPSLYGGQMINPESWSTEKNKAWVAMVDAMSQRYDSDNVIFEIWNEADNDDFWGGRGADPENYVEFAEMTSEAVRRNNPDACIIGPASAGFEVSWVQGTIEHGLLEYVDAISVHPYRKYPKRPDSSRDELRDLQRAIHRNNETGRAIPIVFSEWGYGLSNTNGPNSISKISKLFYEMHEYTIQEDISFFIWYEWRGVQKSAFVDESFYKTSLYDEIHK